MKLVNNNNSETLEVEIRNGATFEGTLSTETPVAREYEDEILLHEEGNIELHTDKLPLLLNHNQDEQIGIVEGIRLVGNKLKGMIRLSDERTDLITDIQEGIRENLSIGYQVLNSYVDDMGQKIVDKFKIFEVSLVPVPADPNSAIGRHQNHQLSIRSFIEDSKMETKKEIRQERERASEILALASHHGMEQHGNEAVESGMSLESFRAKVLDHISNQQEIISSSPVISARSGQEEYSVINAIRGINDVSMRGYEWELSKDLERSQPKTSDNSVILDTRAMVGSSDVVQTSVDTRIQDFIQQKSVIMNLPVTNFSGLQGDLKIPVGTSASGFTPLVTDGTTQSAETDLTFSSKSLSAHRFADVVPLSYGLLQQASPDMENYVRRTIADTFASNFDDQVIGGSGSSGNILGILNTTGINAESAGGSEIAFANILNAIASLGTDNIDLSNLVWLVNPANIDNLTSAVKYSSTASPLLEMEISEGGQIGTMMGYPVYATNRISADNYILGDFSQLAVGNWGGIEVKLNEFFDNRRFISSLNAIYTFDSVVMQPNAFCKMTKA